MVKIASSSMAKLSIHELCVLIIITSFASIVISTTTESVKPTKKSALFVFGDSLFDPGNNQYINGSKPGASSYYPYGQTFFNHPTGRLSDGRIVPDFIALFAKLPMLTPYLQPGGEHDFTAGTNFASAGACALDAPHPQMAAIDLNEQLSYFKKVEEWLKQKLGNEEAKKLLKRAVYLFSIGGNDYFTLSSSYPNITLSYQKEYVGMVIGNLTNVLQEIYEMGGRKIAFQNAGPLGCTPGKRFEHLGNCDQLAMSLATLHNTLLAQSLKNLESHLPGFQYSIFDYYNALYDRIANPSKYGPQGTRPTVNHPEPIAWGQWHNPVDKAQNSWRPPRHEGPTAFRHTAGGTRATSADKDLQSYYHNTSPLMQPITAFITTALPAGTEPPSP